MLLMELRRTDLRELFLRVATLIVAALFFVGVPASSSLAYAQDESPWKGGKPPQSQPREIVVADEENIVERAMRAVCSERARDPLGSVPIDVMQGRPSLPATHPDAVAGLKRAERLLPAARDLVIASLRDLAN